MMASVDIWKISAGKDGYLVDEFLSKGIVAVDFGVTESMISLSSVEEIREIIRDNDKELSSSSVSYRAGRIFTFIHKINNGDLVTIYDKREQCFIFGSVKSGVYYSDGYKIPAPLVRSVNWLGKIHKYKLPKKFVGSLSSPTPLYRIENDIADIILPLTNNLMDIHEIIDPYIYSSKKGDDGQRDEAHASPYKKVVSLIESASHQYPREEYVKVPIYYGTDREPIYKEGKLVSFGVERSEAVHFGIAEVAVPFEHEIGHVEAPPFWKIINRRDPTKYVVILSTDILPKSDYLTEIRQKIYKSSSKDILVFVHGYNMTFDEAVKRTAQITYDLDFKGVPVLFSWPSKGRRFSYPADESTIGWSSHNLMEFLILTANDTGANYVHLLAHSMGNRALLNALDMINVSDIKKHVKFSQIVMAAPDVDQGLYKKLISRITGKGERFTLYASSNDRALSISKRWHKYPRAGYTVPNILILNKVDSVDASKVDTSLISNRHSYISNKKTMLSDLYYLIKDKKNPDQRFGLTKINRGNLCYWSFKP